MGCTGESFSRNSIFSSLSSLQIDYVVGSSFCLQKKKLLWQRTVKINLTRLVFDEILIFFRQLLPTIRVFHLPHMVDGLALYLLNPFITIQLLRCAALLLGDVLERMRKCFTTR